MVDARLDDPASRQGPVAPTVIFIIRARNRTFVRVFPDKTAATEVGLRDAFMERRTLFLVVMIHGRGGEGETPSEAQRPSRERNGLPNPPIGPSRSLPIY